MFADCFGFGDIFADTREVPIANPSLTYAKIKSLGFTNDEIETYRKAHQCLRSALTSKGKPRNLITCAFPHRGIDKPSNAAVTI